MVKLERYHGTVKSFNTYGGSGTIALPDGREVLVRYSAIRGTGIRTLREGALVSFVLEETRRGLCAVCVQDESADH
ncbi:MAG: cold shock domain-containing protein [Chloroflexota bacterium]|jgi:CspA family cold shock protein